VPGLDPNVMDLTLLKRPEEWPNYKPKNEKICFKTAKKAK